MSVLVTDPDGGDRLVPLGDSRTVAALVEVIRNALQLPSPASAYDMALTLGDGTHVDLGTRMDELLVQVGIHGAEERVTLRAKHMYVARAQLEAEGITTCAAAGKALERVVAENSVERVRRITASRLVEMTPHVEAAIRNGATELAEVMLEGHVADGNVQQIFLEACSARARGVAARALAMGAAVDAGDAFGCTALHMAVSSGDAELVEMLVSKGANVNASDNVGCTPLFCAAGRGNMELAEMLVSKGANVNATCDGGFTPLYNATSEGHGKLAAMLVSKGAYVVNPGEDLDDELLCWPSD